MDTNDVIHEQSKLTAYALDELDPAERAEVDARLANDADARQFVQGVRQTADLLRQQLHSEPEPPGLSEAQHLSIDHELVQPARSSGSAVTRRWLWTSLGLTAAACVVAALLPSLSAARKQARSLETPQMAQGNRPEAAVEPITARPRRSKTNNKQITGPAGQRSVANKTTPAPASEETIVMPLSTLGQSVSLHSKELSVDLAMKKLSRAGASDLRSAVLGDEMVEAARRQPGDIPFNTETYDRVIDNPFLGVVDNPLSTFSIDVDTASYANVRRFITQFHRFPPKDAVRIEEMINYFTYDDATPNSELMAEQDRLPAEPPFAVHVEIAAAPWAPQHRLAKIGLKGYQVTDDQRPAANLVFLLDVSGSMRPANKLPLLKRAMGMLINRLTENDRVAIVVYAGASGLVLESTAASDKDVILTALNRLQSGGSTNGGAGIELAYQIAAKHFIEKGINRIVLATDGDFNVGVTDRGALTRLIEKKAKTGVYLTVLGFGGGNLKDATMEELSNKGNGNYAYIDSIQEARKVLVEQIGGTMMTIAKDVKIQVEFNPAQAQAYRLIGYENRILAKEDFNDDTKDAGDIGAGHTVTALYEIVPPGQKVPSSAVSADVQKQIQDLQRQIEEIQGFLANARLTAESTQQMQKEIVLLQDRITQLRKRPSRGPHVDPLKYQRPQAPTAAAQRDELFTLKIRYKHPDAPKHQGTSRLMAFAAKDTGQGLDQASPDFRFASAVASFGMILRDSPYKGSSTFEDVLDLAASGISDSNDPQQYRRQFVSLVEQAKTINNP